MRINAYIMAADPAWIEASVASYYDMVNQIVVAYDEAGLSWSGTALPVEECLERVRQIDRDCKLLFCPGCFARLRYNPMENDTHQRQFALDIAGSGADWVLQLDTDEVLADASEFVRCLREADQLGFGAMEYPARWLYRGLGGNCYLERCSKFWRTTGGFPGPVAVRPGTRLRNARQCDAPLYRVDFREKNTDPWHGRGAPVHRTVKPSHGIIHYSWIRQEEELLRKTSAWGHSKEDWSAEIRHWMWAGRHPHLASAATPFMEPERRVRIVTIPPPNVHANGFGRRPDEHAPQSPAPESGRESTNCRSEKP